MGGVDIIVLTGGIGENGAKDREKICEGLEFLGLEFDKAANDGIRGKEQILSKNGSKVVAMVVPTNEELVIALDTKEIVEKM
jgi:acetate kinase